MVDELHEALRASPLLSGLSESELRGLAARATLRSYGRRQLIYAAGDGVDCVFLLQSGVVRLYHLLLDGHELTIGILGQGELFGLAALLGESSRSRFAQALSPIRCLCLPVAALLDLFGPYSGLLLRMTAQVGGLVGRTEELATSLAFRTVRGRLAQTLLRLYGEQKQSDAISVMRLTHADLAALVGTTREHVTRLLTEFEHAGYILKEHGHIAAVCDRAGLKDEAEALAVG
jgi:CRP/FNR family cyclic AMP-dependent transcriptional regulator